MSRIKALLSGRRGAMVLLALACGMLAAWAMHRAIAQRLDQIEAQARVPTLSRVVAAYDLAAGTALTSAYVAVRDIPEQWVSDAMLTPRTYASLENPVLSHSVKQGEPILLQALAAPAAMALSESVANGRRAITITVDDVSATAGMLRPGDRIDLYVSFDDQGSLLRQLCSKK